MSEHLPSVEQIEAISRIPDYAEALTRLGELVDNDVLNALASDEPPPDWPPGAPPYSQKESAEHWLEASPDERRRLIMLLLAMVSGYAPVTYYIAGLPRLFAAFVNDDDTLVLEPEDRDELVAYLRENGKRLLAEYLMRQPIVGGFIYPKGVPFTLGPLD